ncbi:MAG: 4Fe-4S dicluster domain-containing protein [Candidatus Thorarchaeota archaeon]
MSYLLVDMDTCTGCKQCTLACSFTKEALFDPYRSRIGIVKIEDIALGIPLLCEQCDPHPCVESCPNGALSRNEDSGIITVDENLCTGTGACIDACTYYAIQLHPESKKAIICDLCGGDPYCAPHCTSGALQWIDATKENLKGKKRLRSTRMAKYRQIKKEAV